MSLCPEGGSFRGEQTALPQPSLSDMGPALQEGTSPEASRGSPASNTAPGSSTFSPREGCIHVPRTVSSYLPRTPCASLHNGKVSLQPAMGVQPLREIQIWVWLSGSLGKSLSCEPLGFPIQLLPHTACKNTNPVADVGFLGVVLSCNP